MGTVFRRGFKTLAEEIAGEVRAELRLDHTEPLDCTLLAQHLCIPVVALPELAAYGATADALACLLHPSAGFSAVTVTRGGRLSIAYNPNHAASRQANSLAHELAHILLEHNPAAAINDQGERHWDTEQESEADWLAGAMLVPRDGALWWMRSNGDVLLGAAHYAVSVALFRWRVSHTGVVKQVQREAKARQG